MGQILIRRNAGSKFLVSLGGHDSRNGHIECIVSLPHEPKSGLLSVYKRRALLEKTQKLVAKFDAELLQASKL